MRFPALLAAAAAAAIACAPRANDTTPSTKPQETPAMATTNETVTIEGTAEDAKAGAIVHTPGSEPVYIDGLENGWPAEIHGKRVRVTGVKRVEKRIPDPQSNPISAGAFGDQSILYDATWKVVP